MTVEHQWRRASALIGVGALTFAMTSCGDSDAGDVVDEATAEVSEAATDIGEELEDVDVDIDTEGDADANAE